MLRALFEAGADVFRINFSHGDTAAHRRVVGLIRALERETSRPTGIVGDLQGPKIRVGEFHAGGVMLTAGRPFRLDIDTTPGDDTRVALPHPEVFEVVSQGDELLLNDGRVRLRVDRIGDCILDTQVVVGGALSDHKGLNLPGVVIPVQPLTPKDRADLEIAIELGVDWIAASFVQRATDVAELRERIGGRAGLMTKIEKPSAVAAREEIYALSDGLMVARGDLGVEMPVEQVPGLQKQLIRAARAAGKPIVVATQMLESMVRAPTPTRAEVSDVATAVYDGADAVMLSAESAIGDYPVAAVRTMNRIAEQVEHDSLYRAIIDAEKPPPEATSADAISASAAQTAETLKAAAIVSYTATGATALRAARERPSVPILGLAPRIETARRLALVWGVHCVPTPNLDGFNEDVAFRAAAADGFAGPRDRLVIISGAPHGAAARDQRHADCANAVVVGGPPRPFSCLRAGCPPRGSAGYWRKPLGCPWRGAPPTPDRLMTLPGEIRRIGDEAALLEEAEALGQRLREAKAAIASFIYGQERVVEESLVTLLAGGHGLLIGVPGLAKTRLVETLGCVMGLTDKRVQFTPDLMPADILGSEVLEESDRGRRRFRFLKGPVFCQLLMADEINRASPRTQSALLQAMQEHEVSVGGARHPLPHPFHVLATQNPLEQEGTYPLPEAQLDRFLLQIDVGYPDLDSEREMLHATTGLDETPPEAAMTSDEFEAAQRMVRRLPVGDGVIEAILTIVRNGRPETTGLDEVRRQVAWGPGPRASQALTLAARARALLDGRLSPSVEDVLALAAPALRHRMALNFSARADGVTMETVIGLLCRPLA